MVADQAPANAGLEAYHPVPAPEAKGLLLKEGDRLAICGDSITEQKDVILADDGRLSDDVHAGVERFQSANSGGAESGRTDF